MGRKRYFVAEFKSKFIPNLVFVDFFKFDYFIVLFKEILYLHEFAPFHMKSYARMISFFIQNKMNKT